MPITRSNPFPSAKPWYLSAGIWGAIVTLVVSGLSLCKVRRGESVLRDLYEQAPSVVTLVAGAVSLYGRARATRRIVLFAVRQPARLGRQNWRMNAAAALALLLSPALLAPTGGCQSLPAALQSPSQAYVAADRATFNAVAPEYSAYVHSDPTLDDDSRARRDRTVQTWRARIESAESASAALTDE
jgi:hypothetical protein